jgi:hypothetical protein
MAAEFAETYPIFNGRNTTPSFNADSAPLVPAGTAPEQTGPPSLPRPQGARSYRWSGSLANQHPLMPPTVRFANGGCRLSTTGFQ